MRKNGSIVNGTYVVLRVIGRGGTSVVYLVRNPRAGLMWAMKEVPKDKESFVTDDKILVGLYHPNLPRIVDVMETDTHYLIVMDYIEGKTLRKVLSEEGPQDQDTVVKWGIQLCSVLDYLHSQKKPIIYRDMKPGNIMRRKDGSVVLIDFGTARRYDANVTEDTQALGTRGYAAPEQFGGNGQTDQRTDIYNLGATLYHLVTGHNPSKPPYEIKPIREIDPSLSSGLEKIILKCTQQDPELRYSNCRELMEDLENYKKFDDSYIRQKRFEKAAVALSAFLGAACICAAVILGAAKGRALANSYDSLIIAGETSEDQSSRWAYYKKAIEVDNKQPQAYELILDEMLEDGNFSAADAAYMTSILNSSSGGSNNNKAFSTSDGYPVFAYHMGQAYFYYYEGDGNKQLSKAWFELAAGSKKGLTEQQMLRAERFYKIADYYSRLGKKDKAGDSELSYGSYWEDISALTEGDIASEDNMQTAVVMYKELTSQISMHAYDFRKADVASSSLYGKLDDIEARIGDFPLQAGYDSTLEDDLGIIRNNIKAAREAVETAYSGTYEPAATESGEGG